MARKWARAHGLGDDDVIVSRERLEELQSALYVLQAAIEDTDRDLAAAEPSDAVELRQMLAWLLENSRPLAAMWVEPRALELT